VRYNDAPHVSVSNWADYGTEGDNQWDNGHTLEDYEDCGNPNVVAHASPAQEVVTEIDRDYASRFDHWEDSRHPADKLLTEHIV
jgi:hypothetical protein